MDTDAIHDRLGPMKRSTTAELRRCDEAVMIPRHRTTGVMTRRDIVDGKVRTSKTTYRRIIATSGVDGRRSSFGAPPFHNATAFYHIHVLCTFARSLECVAEVA